MYELMHFDHLVAGWFHARQTPQIAEALHLLSAPGSALWIAVVLTASVAYALWRRHWYGLMALVITVPGGMLLGEAIKLLVHRHRPYLVGPFVDWSGYSFPSGHTIGATLLYGWVAFLLVRMFSAWHWRAMSIIAAVLVVFAVGFSRVALGAHYFTDVIAAMVIGTMWLGLCFGTVEVVRRARQPVVAAEVSEPDRALAAADQTTVAAFCRLEPRTALCSNESLDANRFDRIHTGGRRGYVIRRSFASSRAKRNRLGASDGRLVDGGNCCVSLIAAAG
jgi:membrane-associated phospholipid phosphatase